MSIFFNDFSYCVTGIFLCLFLLKESGCCYFFHIKKRSDNTTVFYQNIYNQRWRKKEGMSESSSFLDGFSTFYSSTERRPVTNWNMDGRVFSTGLTAGGITGGAENTSSCAAVDGTEVVFCS